VALSSFASNLLLARLRDALGREAIARTRIVGRTFEITMKSDLAEEEQSVTLYHEILEAAAVASPNPPSAVIDFNKEFDVASVENLNRMLKSYGFNEH